MIEQTIQQYLSGRPIAAGQIVNAGWLVFRIANEGPPVVLESLDFQKVASFTQDLREAEKIFEMQSNMLHKHSVEGEPCTLRHTAVVSKSYSPGHPKAYIKRDTVAKDIDSGWYVGVLDDTLDIENVNSYISISLYELSIADRRMLPYWLMPVDTVVSLENGLVGVVK